MNTLNATYPHFVRCIIPNEAKTPGLLEAKLVLHQLQCNGILEGVRISRKGYPNRLAHHDFLHRYSCLAPQPATDTDPRTKCQQIFDQIGLDSSLYCVGLTKCLLKPGVINKLDQLRVQAAQSKIQVLQNFFRRCLALDRFRTMHAQAEALQVLQKNLKAYIELKSWPWRKLQTDLVPIIELMRTEKEASEQAEAARRQKEIEDELKRLDVERRAAMADDLEAMYRRLEKVFL
jgi:myosin heavy subunit